MVNLYRGDGTIKTHYEYDSWGRVLSVTDENGNPITAKDNIGHVNPIRYRGYYYDTDTGLYYLKSRYYDPELGRFISSEPNVDCGEFDEGAGMLAFNVYAYCANSPINAYDPTGNDAIWLQDKNAVYGAGHTGLLLQDSSGAWWHFYLGNNRSGSKGKKGNGKTLLRYKGSLNLESINRFYSANYGGKYSGAIRFTGDFSKSVAYAKQLSSRSYNLLWNNCMQVSVDVLGKGSFRKNNFEYKLFLRKIRLNPVPNIAFSRMIAFYSVVSVWNATPWYLRRTMAHPAVAVMIF